jgi:hypothetical protein
MKKRAVFVGNCHNTCIIHFLKFSPEFMATYDIQSFFNWQLIEGRQSLELDAVKSADLFVYQPLAAEHGLYSTDPTVPNSIGSMVKDSAVKIAYPYTYCSSLWPICQAALGQNRWFGHESIVKLQSEGATNQDILRMYDNDAIDWQYESRFEQTMNILERKEEFTDIKVSKYIRDNFRSMDLFLIPQHPTSILMLEVANQLLDRTGFSRVPSTVIVGPNDFNNEDSTYQRSDCRFPMHSSAIRSYGLTWTNPSSDAHDFYRVRLQDYLRMNPTSAEPADWVSSTWGFVPTIKQELG